MLNIVKHITLKLLLLWHLKERKKKKSNLKDSSEIKNIYSILCVQYLIFSFIFVHFILHAYIFIDRTREMLNQHNNKKSTKTRKTASCVTFCYYCRSSCCFDRHSYLLPVHCCESIFIIIPFYISFYHRWVGFCVFASLNKWTLIQIRKFNI